jgi:prepilin-type N-terminal cleavage/methylation domain-containing protein
MEGDAMKTQVRVARGFSLLELTLVVAMIAVLMAVAVFSFPGILGRTKVRATLASMNTIKTAINSYNGMYSVNPPTLAALQAGATPFLDKGQVLEDGWRQPFIYTATGQGPEHPFELISKGPDQKYGTGDDLNVWSMPRD